MDVREKDAWKTTPLCLYWMNCRERNRDTYEALKDQCGEARALCSSGEKRRFLCAYVVR